MQDSVLALSIKASENTSWFIFANHTWERINNTLTQAELQRTEKKKHILAE